MKKHRYRLYWNDGTTQVICGVSIEEAVKGNGITLKDILLNLDHWHPGDRITSDYDGGIWVSRD